MQSLNLKPTHKFVKNYYEVLGQFGQLNLRLRAWIDGGLRDVTPDSHLIF